MRPAGRSVGPRGSVLLLAAAVAGGVLAIHGWSTRQQSLPLGALSSSTASSPTPSGTVAPSPSAAPSAGGSASPTPSGGGSAAPSAGPLLASQSFASYSFQVWPGTPSAAAKAAMTGLSISVQRAASGISVKAGVIGHPGSAHTYPTGARVYVVEASMGDEGGNADYNLGDDGVVVTDAHGRIVQ